MPFLHTHISAPFHSSDPHCHRCVLEVRRKIRSLLGFLHDEAKLVDQGFSSVKEETWRRGEVELMEFLLEA